MRYKTTNVLQLANTVLQRVQKEKLFNSEHNLLIMFSGGQDSAFCLLVLFLLKNKTRFTWNRTKLLNLLKQHKTERTITRQIQKSCFGVLCRHAKNKVYALPFQNEVVTKNKVFCTEMRSFGVQKTLFFAKTEFLCKNFIFATLALPKLRFGTTEFRLPELVQAPKKQSLCKNFIFATQEQVQAPKISLLRYKASLCIRNKTKLLQKTSFFARECEPLALQSFALYSPFQATYAKISFLQRFAVVRCKNEVCVQPRFYNRFGTTFIPVTSFEQKKVAYTNLINGVESKYTLLWCNHFWQKDSFFTMEHVSKLTFCKNYTICFFVPIKKIVSEQSARNWRHKVMQRSSFFLRQKKSCYEHVELYLNLVFIAALKAPKTKQIFVSSQHVQRNRTLNIQIWPEQLCVQGHNKSDRAEAILFNLIKGTGMNGISTLQWKHTFFSSSNSNHMFYPVFFDFFKEIRIVCLNSSFTKSCRQKRTVKTDKAFLGVTMFWHTGVKINELLNSNKLEHRFFPKNTYVKSLYYQLKYKTKKI